VKGSKDVTFASGHRRRGRRTKREEERRVGLTVWALIPGQPHSRLSDLGPAHIRPFLFYFIFCLEKYLQLVHAYYYWIQNIRFYNDDTSILAILAAGELARG
jgi:hypothetical protein